MRGCTSQIIQPTEQDESAKSRSLFRFELPCTYSEVELKRATLDGKQNGCPL